ncbi:MAG: phospholipid carrier-dependent glycosyltransferase, partial [Verrucomicrobiaceae bacterium]
MTRLHALFILLAFWAAIYLPGLGSTELKGEEGRRILPAVTMLDSGNWLVPYVGGEPYFRKPPLVNWLIAGSMKLTGVRNEWAARLPSVLCVLALGLVVVVVCSRWLGVRTALAAGLFAIANVSMIEKGRLAEIEAIYVALAGIGMVIWMAWALRGGDASPAKEEQQAQVSSWLLWTVPFVFLGLAALAKGPVHLLFFYALVLAVPRGRREFISLPHLTGLLLMAGIFACWAVPYFEAAGAMRGEETQASAAGVWYEQAAERFGGGSFVLSDWLLSLPART